MQHFKARPRWWHKLAWFVLGVLVALLGLYLVRSPSPEDVDAARYCAMVSEGLWPDYLDTYDHTCKAGLPTR